MEDIITDDKQNYFITLQYIMYTYNIYNTSINLYTCIYVILVAKYKIYTVRTDLIVDYCTYIPCYTRLL